MSEQGPQGMNGVSLADRAVRQLGIEVANAQISLATQNARLEELAEAASHINLDLWEEMVNHTHSIAIPDNETGVPSYSSGASFKVPVYQVDAVARLLALLGR